MAYKSKFMQEMEQQGKLSAASSESKYKSKFFQEGGHLGKEVTPAPMRTATDQTFPTAAKPEVARVQQKEAKSPTAFANEAGLSATKTLGVNLKPTTAYMTEISGLQVQEAQNKLTQAEQKKAAAQQRAQQILTQRKDLETAAKGIQELQAKYSMTGDDVDAQSILLAQQEYQQRNEKLQEDIKAYEKESSAFTEYDNALLKYQKARLQNEKLAAQQQEKQDDEKQGLWQSGPVEFIDRTLSAIQAGQTDWLAGVAQLDRKIGNAALHMVGSQIYSMAMATGNDGLLQTANEILGQSKTESTDAKAALQASQDYLNEALAGTGKVDGWIIQQMQSVGSMMMDMMVAGSTYAMGIPDGADTRKIMAIRAGGSSMLQAQEEGKTETEQILTGIANGALEYASEGMFGGNPIYDAESGWVTNALEKVIKNPKIMKLFYSNGFDIFAEGIEEWFTAFVEPIAEGLITWEKPEMATAEELANAFAGGMFLSLIGQGSSVVVREVSGAGRAERQAGRIIRDADAVQELVSEGLAAKQGSEAYELAVKLQKKLDSGKTVTAAEIGRQLFANQDAIDAGLLVDEEMQPDKTAPEGALQDPENGYYAIQTAETDGKQTYQLAEVREDGSIRKIGNPVDDLMAAKRAAQAQGMDIRHIGKVEVLRDATRSTTGQVNAADTESTVTENAADNENTGLRWAGNEEGAIDYGAEQRDVGTGADQERVGGNAAGGSAESQGDGRTGDTVRRAEEARRIRAYAENAGIERQSLRELGFARGSDSKSLRVLNRSAGQEVAEAFDAAQNADLRLVPVSGNMYVQVGSDESRVTGIIADGVIYAQADSTAMSIHEVVMHEIFHDRAAKDPTLVRRLVNYMWDNYSQREISKRFEQYYEDYRDIYSGRATDDELREMIWEEMLADAYAEYARYAQPDLEGLSETVQEQAWAGGESGQNRNAAQELSRGVTENGSLAKTTSAASDGIINQPGESVNERLSIARTQNMSWDEQINGALYNGKNIRRNDTLVVGNSEDTSVANDIDNRPLAIPLSVLTKASNGKDISHSIKKGKLTKLDDGIKNAPITILNPDRNAVVYITNIKQGGLPVIAAFDLNANFDGDNVHKATSIHLQVDTQAMLENLPESATVYVRKNEPDPVGATNNLRGLAAKIKFIEDNVSQQNEDVNTRFSAAQQKSYSEIEEERQALYQRERQLAERKREAVNNPELMQAMNEYTDMLAEMRALLPRRRNGTATQEELNRIEEIKESRNEKMKRVEQIQEELGLREIEEEEREIREMKEELRIASDEAWEREGEEKENRAIEKTGLSAADYFRKKALKAFKTTTNFNEAGYLLPDGKMLDFSGGERNHRYRDHREIGEIYEATTGVKALNRFLRDGNIRVMAESPGLDITSEVEPTKEQYAVIKKFVNSHGENEEKFFVDFSDADGRRAGDLSYEGRVNADRVVNDIKHYFATGEIREQSEIEKFLFSVSSEDRARQRAERELARGIGDIMSMPTGAVRQLQTGLVREIMEEYQQTGELNTEKLADAASNAFAQGLLIDNEYYETYKHIKDRLRSTAVTISQQDQADIADYTQFRKRAFGTLRIVKQGGIPVDSLYQELMEEAPGLFPRTITHPADQLVKMYEVAREIRRVETPLERAMGDQSDQFYEWAEGKIADLTERVLTRYADSVKWKQPREQTRQGLQLTDDAPDSYDRANERMFRAGQERMGGYDPEYQEGEPDTYDPRTQEGMYNYGQQTYREAPVPGSGVESPDYLQPEEGGVVWAGQSRVGNWRQELPEYEPDTYDPTAQEIMERFGQEIIDDYEPAPTEQETMTEEERARRGSMREWIQYVLSDKLTPEQFAEKMRQSSVGELRGGAATLVGRMEETARQRQGDGQNLYRDPEMTDEQYEALNAAWQNRQQRKLEDLETAAEIVIQKNAFRSTPSMDKLGIKIDGSVTRYRETAQLRAYDEAAEKAQRMLNRRIRKLNATKQEMNLAKMLVDGTITPAMLDSNSVNINVVTELADYLGAVDSFNDDRINQRRAEINTNNLKIAKELLQDSEAYHPQLPGVLAGMTKLVMNERTPERVVKQIFGTEQGGKIYETYFRPVWVNGAEMHRFENRMLKRVETFKDQDGRERKLTEKEREFAQRLMEGEAVRMRMEQLGQEDPDARERIEAAAQNVNNGMEYLDAVRDQNIQEEEHQGLVQAHADYMDTVTISKDMDQTILWNAIREYQKIYNEMYEAMNDFLVSHGYKAMGFIKGYAPHFQKREVQQGLFGALKALGVEKEGVTELPASIAGRTADFKPNMKWNPHMQSRKGEATSYDIQMGFEQYLHYAAEMFYHTDDVMRIRQAVNWMRSQYSGEEISNAIKDAEVDQFKNTEWKRDFLLKKEVIQPQNDLSDKAVNQAYQEYVSGLFERVKPENLRKYSEFVTWLDNYANIVAGKQSLADRGLEYGGGRNALNMGSKMMRRFASSNVAGNVSSVLNQTAQLPLLQQQLGTYLERAMFDMARGGTRKENFSERSDFLTDKRGVEKLTTDNMEKIISALFKPAEMMDRLVSTLAVRGRYLQALDQGMTADEAMKAADDFGRRVMGSRMKGARPLGFESKTFVNQMLHIFQTEASNTFDYMLLSDMPQAVKEVRKTKGKGAAARYVAASVMGYLVNAFLLNALTDELYGGSPAPFDVIGWFLNFVAGGWGRDDEDYVKTLIDNSWERAYGERPFETEPLDREEGFQWAGAADDLGYNVLGDVPYVRNVMGVLGLGDQSLPTVGINDLITSVQSAGKTLWDQVTKGQEETGLDWAGAAAKIGEDLLDAATLVMPGGRQIQKTYQGTKSMIQGGKVSGFGENARLQYPIEQNAWNAIRAGLFGLTALDETDAFYAGGQALTAGQTQKVRELEEKGIDQNISYNLYQEFREINKDLAGAEASEAKRNAINDLPLDDQQKLTVFDTFMLDQSSKNYEKTLNEYQAMLDAGLSWSEVTDAHNTYAALDADEEMSGTEKATEFAKWVDLQGWNEQQRDTIEARFRFWNMMPAEATNYAKFEAAGLDPEQAAGITEKLAALTPEEGKETVTTNQKVLAVKESDLTNDEKMDAIAALVPDRQERFVEAGVSDGTAKTLAAEIAIAEAENGDDEVTYLEKARVIVEKTPNDEEALAAMSVVLNDSTYAKVEIIREYGIRCENWVSFREEWLDRYGDESMSQEKVETVLDRMNLNSRQKAALWQISNKSWKPDNNPYDTYVAEMVWDALN